MNKLEQAIEDQKQGKIERAQTAYEEIIREEPENADARYCLAILQMGQNNLEKSLETINKAINIESQAPAYNQIKGSILARLGKVDEAIIELQRAIKGNPNLYQAYIVLGHIYYTKGLKSEAENHFNLAIKIDSEQPEGQVNLARILLDEGDIEEAINILRTIEKEHPDQASVKMMMGQAFIENGAYNYAENYFQKVLAMHPDYDLAGLYLGITKLNTGDMKNAENLIFAFNKQYPNTREGIAAAGLYNYRNQRYAAAVEYLKKAIGDGLSPLSWRAALAESLVKMGALQPAVEFYKKQTKKSENKAAEFRLGELYERQSKLKKAKKQYKKISKNDRKYIASLLGLTRVSMREENYEKAEILSNSVLKIMKKHAEATLLLLTSLLNQNRFAEALEILEKLNYSDYNDVYRRTFRLFQGLIYDNQKQFDKAMAVFQDESKLKMQEVPKNKKLTEDEIKKIQAFKTKIDDELINPIFIIGAQSTGVNDFALWLNEQGVFVLNDRLVSLGRPDILFAYQDIEAINNIDDEMVEIERKVYHQKTPTSFNSSEFKKRIIVDCMYINPSQLAIVKKVFPDASVVLLKRETPDIWLNQKVWGQEPVESSEWNETVNQVIAMGLKLTQIDYDLWQQNDNDTHEKIKKLFNIEKQHPVKNNNNYWQKTHFLKGHWKNYKNHLGA